MKQLEEKVYTIIFQRTRLVIGPTKVKLHVFQTRSHKRSCNCNCNCIVCMKLRPEVTLFCFIFGLKNITKQKEICRWTFVCENQSESRRDVNAAKVMIMTLQVYAYH